MFGVRSHKELRTGAPLPVGERRKRGLIPYLRVVLRRSGRLLVICVLLLLVLAELAYPLNHLESSGFPIVSFETKIISKRVDVPVTVGFSIPFVCFILCGADSTTRDGNDRRAEIRTILDPVESKTHLDLRDRHHSIRVGFFGHDSSPSKKPGSRLARHSAPLVRNRVGEEPLRRVCFVGFRAVCEGRTLGLSPGEKMTP